MGLGRSTLKVVKEAHADLRRTSFLAGTRVENEGVGIFHQRE